MSTTWINRGHFYVPHVRPVLLDCNFTVDSTNGNGFGVRSLKGQGIASVFMNTSAAFTGTSHTSTLIDGIASGTSNLKVGMPVQGSGITAGTTIVGIPTSGSITLSAATSSSTTGSITYQGVAVNGQVNPNPAAGLIQVQFSDNFMRYYGGSEGFVGPVGSSTTSTVANVINVITVLGTATLAQWLTAGLKPGIAPAVGAAFIPTASALIGGSAQTAIIAAAGAGIDHIEVNGDPNLTINPIPVGGSPNVGGFIYLACYKNTVLTAPAAGTTIGLQFYMSQSSVLVKGE